MAGTVVVRTAEGGRYLHEVEAGGHRLTADEPAEAGGTGRGPTPFEMLLGALGACTSMTMRMYAERKGWALRSVEVTLERRKVEGEKGARDEVLRGIRMEGDLDAEQRRRLLEIADRCPVHRALSEGTRVVTEAR